MIQKTMEAYGLAGWNIVGCNHYAVAGEKRLFIALTNAARQTIKVEGLVTAEAELWETLRMQAQECANDRNQRRQLQVDSDLLQKLRLDGLETGSET